MQFFGSSGLLDTPAIETSSSCCMGCATSKRRAFHQPFEDEDDTPPPWDSNAVRQVELGSAVAGAAQAQGDDAVSAALCSALKTVRFVFTGD